MRKSGSIVKCHDVKNLSCQLASVMTFMTFMASRDICDIYHFSINKMVPKLKKDVVGSVICRSHIPRTFLPTKHTWSGQRGRRAGPGQNNWRRVGSGRMFLIAGGGRCVTKNWVEKS